MPEPKPVINEHIKVYIRQRPAVGSQEALDPIAQHTSAIKNYAENGACSYYQSTSKKQHEFRFEGFLAPSVLQAEAYDLVARPIVDSALQGYSGTIFAYGPTNSGKTFTMRGSDNDWGIMPRCIDQLLTATNGGKGEIWVSYLQIYCEVISDLLNPTGNTSTNTDGTAATTGIAANDNNQDVALRSQVTQLSIRERSGTVFVEGLSRSRINRVEDLYELLSLGDANRTTAATNFNEGSSRSHAALMVTVLMNEEMIEGGGGTTVAAVSSKSSGVCSAGSSGSVSGRMIRESNLVLVDLAGSERAAASEGRHLMRLEEAKAINLSLSALGNCMNALAEGRAHIPYRDSKLTRLLQGSLGGGARTAVIVNIPPGSDENGEVLNALRFASRASKVKVAAKVMRYINYEGMYNELQSKLDAYEQAESTKEIKLSEAMEALEQRDLEIERLRDEVRVLRGQLKMFYGKDSNSFSSSSSSSSTTNASSAVGGSSGSTSGGGGNSSNSAPANWEEQLKTLTEHHMSDLANLRQQMERKVTNYRLSAEAAQQEVASLEYELSGERQRHLSTLQDTKMYQQRAMGLENTMEGRVQELLGELAEKGSVVDDLQEARRLDAQRADAAQQAVVELHDQMSDMVSKSQVKEMEALFLDTVSRLSNRVNELESRRKGSAGGSGSGGSAAGGGVGGSSGSEREGGGQGQGGYGGGGGGSGGVGSGSSLPAIPRGQHGVGGGGALGIGGGGGGGGALWGGGGGGVVGGPGEKQQQQRRGSGTQYQQRR